MQRYKKHLIETTKLALPVAIAQLGHVMLGVVDSMMVGKIGADPLAASALVNGLTFLLVVFGLGMTHAITPLVAIADGKNDSEQCGIILRQSLLVNLVVVGFIVLIIYFLADYIALLNQPENVAVLAISYTKIINASIIPFILFQTYRQFIEGLSFTRPAMYITLAANLVNVFGNWVFIYGNLGSPAYGLDGAGYSTFLTRLFMAVVLMAYVLKSQRFKVYKPDLKLRSLNWPVINKILHVGVPTGLQHFFEVGAFSFSAIMIGWLGSSQLAAHQIALSMASVSFMIILGISSAGTIRVGQAFGRGNPVDVHRAGFVTVFYAGAVMSVFGTLFIIFRSFLPLIFISEKEVVQIASALLIVAAFFQISDGTQAAGLGILRGITDVKIPMVISFIAYWIIGLPVGYLFGFILDKGVVGIWIGFLVGLSIAAFFFNIRFNILSHRLKGSAGKTG